LADKIVVPQLLVPQNAPETKVQVEKEQVTVPLADKIVVPQLLVPQNAPETKVPVECKETP